MDGSNGESHAQMAEPVPADSSKEFANHPDGAGDSAAVNHVNGVSSSGSSHSKSHKSSHGDKHRSSSSSSKHHSSSSSKHHSSSASKSHSSSSSHKHSSSHSSSKHHSSSSGDKKHHSSSSKSGSSGEKRHHSSSSSGDKKHHSSSSSGDKKHSSSSSKHGSSSSGDKKHHSSSSSSKHHSSSSSGDKKYSSKPHSSSSKHSSNGENKHHSSSGSSHKHNSSSDKVKLEENKPDMGAMMSDDGDFQVKSEPTSPLKLSIKKERLVEQPPQQMFTEESEDDMPLSSRVKEEVRSPTSRAAKRTAIVESDDEDDMPLSARKEMSAKKVKAEPAPKKRKAENMDMTPKKKKKPAAAVKTETSPTKKKKKGEQPAEEKWKWWEEAPRDDGVKWRTLEHKGPVFAPAYERCPKSVRFYYAGNEMKLSDGAEEVAGFYARMLDHDYTTKDMFNKNFFKDWRRFMTSSEKATITDLKKCNFRELQQFFAEESEKRKNRTKEEKEALKKENAAIQEEYGWCIIDGHKQKIGNFRIEPPGLFRGRGDHPKQGMLKTRTMPEDVIINCSKHVKPPPPPEGHRWKEVRHDNSVSWLACWTENVQNSTKYVMLNAASRMKGEKDWMKYETARKLHKCADKIRAQYREDWKSKEMRIRQRSVSMYFIDKLALRAGNEKDEETADTVGCCSLRVEHLSLHEELDGQQNVVEFDFLGKDSIRYYNKVQVEKRVFKNLQLFSDNKAPGDDLFDRLNTAILNKHLQSLMDGLTAKVFRTYNASKTLQEQLTLLTNEDDNVAAKMLSYNRANRAVAVLCNHQRAPPKNFSKQMENLQNKIDAKKDQIKDSKRDMKALKADLKASKSIKAKTAVDKKKKAIERLEEQLMKLEVQATDKDENKEIALGTSKLNYLDPRISVAWCRKFDVPIEKVYNKTQREKFAWAIDMADEEYEF